MPQELPLSPVDNGITSNTWLIEFMDAAYQLYDERKAIRADCLKQD